jgi:GNAT superfamily N-acetyltransferase
VRVRAAVLADAQRIAEVHVLSWQSGYRGMLPQAVLDGLRPSQRVPRWTATVLAADWPRRGTLVAEEAGDVIGFADLRPASVPVGEIASFYVLPAAWGRGVGRALMTAAVDALHVAGFVSAALWVLDSNVPAIRFYERLGWVPDGAVRGDMVGGAPIRDLRYRLDLG